MKCKKCGKESNILNQSGAQGRIEWKDLGYCPSCFSEYRKERGIKSLREIDTEIGMKEKIKKESK